MAKKYNRIMLGRAGRFAKMCREEGYIGANFDIKKDLSDSLPENWRQFNEQTLFRFGLKTTLAKVRLLRELPVDSCGR